MLIGSKGYSRHGNQCHRCLYRARASLRRSHSEVPVGREGYRLDESKYPSFLRQTKSEDKASMKAVHSDKWAEKLPLPLQHSQKYQYKPTRQKQTFQARSNANYNREPNYGASRQRHVSADHKDKTKNSADRVRSSISPGTQKSPRTNQANLSRSEALQRLREDRGIPTPTDDFAPLTTSIPPSNLTASQSAGENLRQETIVESWRDSVAQDRRKPWSSDVRSPHDDRHHLRKKDVRRRFLSDEEVEPKEVIQATKGTKKRTKEVNANYKRVIIPPFISVSNLANLVDFRISKLVRMIADLGIQNANHDYVLSGEMAGLICLENNIEYKIEAQSTLDLAPLPFPSDVSKYPLRPPVVTLMGHVDHGKTTLLDKLRNSSVAEKEAGGITQHIGAFTVQLPSGKEITFLDTPGHAAFLEMRARGAKVTDIIVLVVAADDGIKPQTEECIKHAKLANVPMIVAINKIDKEDADVERTKRQLADHGVDLEEFGGETQAIEVSGLREKGLDNLEEAIVILSEVLNHRAPNDGLVEGWVVESDVRQGLGSVATIIVKRGTLKNGSFLIAGNSWTRVKSMKSSNNEEVVEAGPGVPVQVFGWKSVPQVGADVLEADSEAIAKLVVANRDISYRHKALFGQVDKMNAERAQQRTIEAEKAEAIDSATSTKSITSFEEVPFIVKADVLGSIEAVVNSIAGIGNEFVGIKIISTGVGNISISDVKLAETTKGMSCQKGAMLNL